MTLEQIAELTNLLLLYRNEVKERLRRSKQARPENTLESYLENRSNYALEIILDIQENARRLNNHAIPTAASNASTSGATSTHRRR
jgi:hypothetical protein